MGLKLADLRNFSRRGRVEGGSVQTKLAELLGAQGARTWPGSFLRSWVPSTRSVSAAAVKMAFSTRKMDQHKRGCPEGAGRHFLPEHAENTASPPSRWLILLPLGTLGLSSPRSSTLDTALLGGTQFSSQPRPSQGGWVTRTGGCVHLLSQTKSHTACRPGTTESPLHPDHVSFPLSCYSLLSWNSFQVQFFHFLACSVRAA